MPPCRSKYDAAPPPATTPGGTNACVPSLDDDRRKYSEDGGHVVLDDVPLFDAHDGAEEGLDGVQFDAALLQKIVDACNARGRDTGDWPPVLDRHTSDDPSAPQPEVLGYACDFKLGRIGKVRPRPCVMATLRIRKDKWEKARQLPRRSIELWTDDLAIDPVVLSKERSPIDSVALLGGERPARDLGLLAAGKAGPRRRYSRELQGGTLDTEQIIKQVLDALAQSPEMAFIRELMAKQEDAGLAQEEKPDMAYSEDEAMPATEAKADDVEGEEDEDKLSPARLRMQRDQERRRYAKLQAAHDQLAAKVASLERSERVAARKADLLGLEAEGVSFDMGEELELVQDMEPARYSRHLATMRKRYQRAPVGVSIKPAPVPADGGTPESLLTPDKVYEAAIRTAHERYGKGR